MQCQVRNPKSSTATTPRSATSSSGAPCEEDGGRGERRSMRMARSLRRGPTTRRRTAQVDAARCLTDGYSTQTSHHLMRHDGCQLQQYTIATRYVIPAVSCSSPRFWLQLELEIFKRRVRNRSSHLLRFRMHNTYVFVQIKELMQVRRELLSWR